MTDAWLDSLMNLQNLKFLSLQDCLTPAAGKKLREGLPKCTFSMWPDDESGK